MKIGILTFHSEINYGSVLQAYAMQRALESMGHEPVVIDKYEDADNRRLLGLFVRRGFFFWFRFVVRSLLGFGDWWRAARSLKTIRFIRRFLKRTPYHFFKWQDAPDDLGVDMITIGSDQVWNPIIVDPPDYLMKDNPGNVPAIAYSASIGQHEFEDRWLPDYRAGFARLVAIGVREREAKRMIEALGFPAEHVLDPTLLVDPRFAWAPFLKTSGRRTRKRLFCYFLGEDDWLILSELEKLVESFDVDVRYFFAGQPEFDNGYSLSSWLKRRRELGRWRSRRVIGMMTAAPDEFVREITESDWVLTNSFHGLMFATIFRKEVREVVPTAGYRKAMSARIEEFADGAITGPLIQPSVAAALDSLTNGERVSYNSDEIERRRVQSRVWLQNAIEKCKNCRCGLRCK